MPKPWIIDGVAVWPPTMREFRLVVKLTSQALRSTDPIEKAAISQQLKAMADRRRVSNGFNEGSEVSTGLYLCGQQSTEESELPF